MRVLAPMGENQRSAKRQKLASDARSAFDEAPFFEEGLYNNFDSEVWFQQLISPNIPVFQLQLLLNI